jgi:hypothetical protein
LENLPELSKSLKFTISKISVFQPSANEYNIADKIKQANQELYSEPNVHNSANNRRVRFRDQLEDFEPEENSEEEGNSQGSNQRVLELDNVSEVSSDDGYGESNNSDIERPMEEINCEDIEEILSTKSDQESEVSEICEQLEEKLDLKNDELCEEDSIEIIELEPELPRKSTNPLKPNSNEDDDESGIQLCFSKKYRPKSGKIKPAAEILAEKKVKSCCEHKKSDEYLNKLPSYNGLHSIYGLNSEQLQKKFQNEQKNLHLKQLREMKKNEQKEIHEATSEEAFRSWLIEKLRYPMNKSKNMFDKKFKCRRRKKTQKVARIEPSPDNEFFDEPMEHVDVVQEFKMEETSTQIESEENHEENNDEMENSQEPTENEPNDEDDVEGEASEDNGSN